MQIATSVIANGQYGAGSAGMLVIPNIDVTNVSGCRKVSLWTVITAANRGDYHEEQINNSQHFDVVPLVNSYIRQLNRLPRLLNASA